MKNNIKTVLSLTVICAVVSLLLALTNSITAPIIKEQENSAVSEGLKKVLPGGEDFKIIDLASYKLPETVEEAYSEKNGGFVIKLKTSGYGSDLILMFGINKDGVVEGQLACRLFRVGIGIRQGDGEALCVLVCARIRDAGDVGAPFDDLCGAENKVSAVVAAGEVAQAEGGGAEITRSPCRAFRHLHVGQVVQTVRRVVGGEGDPPVTAVGYVARSPSVVQVNGVFAVQYLHNILGVAGAEGDAVVCPVNTYRHGGSFRGGRVVRTVGNFLQEVPHTLQELLGHI